MPSRDGVRRAKPVGLRAALVLALATAAHATATAEPLRLHPRNPRYFELGGKPAVLIGSGEHYGAVVNLDFDFGPYLDELKANKLNLTRVFTGAYIEDPKAFGITRNTLAPRPGRFIAPWARVPGKAKGEPPKLDLARWDPAYFRRLKTFVREAARRGVVVEVVLFCPFYEESMWLVSPLNARNNVNGIGAMARTEVYTARDQAMQAIQEMLVRKIVTELNDLDNVYFEICNEPYFGGVTLEWQRRIADVIVTTERTLPRRHLVAQNIANGSAKVENPHPAVSVFNFHYAAPPTAVAENWALGKPIGFDETGFKGTGDEPYRLEGWEFLLAGGAVYDHLDYSFTTEHERGTYAIPSGDPGGGGRTLRQQLRVLADFMASIDYLSMAPADDALRGPLSEELQARVLARPGEAYAVYLRPKPGKTSDYSVQWTGFIEPRYSETYTFHLLSNDGARLWIDDLPIIDNWTTHAPVEDRGTVALVAGRRVPIRIEYFQAGGSAVARLSWSSVSQKKEVVPAGQLRTPDGKPGGLEGRYLLDREWRTWGMTRVDATIDFDWSATSPFVKVPPRGQERRVELRLDLPAGHWRAEWIDPIRGGVVRSEVFEHDGGDKALPSPPFAVDIALRLKRG